MTEQQGTWIQLKAEGYFPSSDERKKSCALDIGVCRIDRDTYETRKFRVRVSELKEGSALLRLSYDEQSCQMIEGNLLAFYPQAEDDGFIEFTVNVYLEAKGEIGSVLVVTFYGTPVGKPLLPILRDA